MTFINWGILGTSLIVVWLIVSIYYGSKTSSDWGWKVGSMVSTMASVIVLVLFPVVYFGGIGKDNTAKTEKVEIKPNEIIRSNSYLFVCFSDQYIAYETLSEINQINDSTTFYHVIDYNYYNEVRSSYIEFKNE